MSAIREGMRQVMAWLHGWTGLALGWVLFVMCLAGTMSVFKPEISRWMRPEATASAGRVERGCQARATARAGSRRSGCSTRRDLPLAARTVKRQRGAIPAATFD